MLIITSRAELKWMGADSFCWCPATERGGKDQKLECRKFDRTMRKSFLQGNRALEQANQRGCGISFSGDIKNPPGHFPR